MKKVLSLVLALLLACSLASAAFAASLDLTTITDNPKLFSLEPSDDGEAAFIESQLSVKNRSYVHKYESANRYSSTQWDILIVNYNTADAYPVLRLWVNYCADNYLNITSVSFIVDGKEYLFTGISDPEKWHEKDEKGAIENVLIKFGTSNLQFPVALENIFSGSDDVVATAEKAKCTMILHGDEDIEVELGEGFFLDFLTIKLGFTNMNGLDFLDKPIASKMEVK